MAILNERVLIELGGLVPADVAPAFIERLLQIYLRAAPQVMADLIAAHAQNRGDACAKYAHKLKGMSAELGLEDLAGSAAAIEDRFRQHGAVAGSDELFILSELFAASVDALKARLPADH